MVRKKVNTVGVFLGLFLLLPVGFLVAQTAKKVGDLPGDMAHKVRDLSAPRPMNYMPEGEGLVSINGQNRYTRALYGSPTLFRIETSDRPVFATYNKKINKHISFKLVVAGKTMALDSTTYCKSIYLAGRRDYILEDSSWNINTGKGQLKLSVNAFYNKEGGVWKFEPENLPKGTQLICEVSEIRAARLNRSGDLGVDPADGFDAPLHPKDLQTFSVDVGISPIYIVFEEERLAQLDPKTGETAYQKAEAARRAIAGTLKINTPDPYINTLGGTIAMAADGIWDGQVWQHGAVGWRMPLPGWRAAYVGDALGWHDRATVHFDNYAASQVTNIPVSLPQPQQDSSLNLTRGLQKWGTPMYSNGYICRNPRNNHQMHHYDMNMVYIDELLWHLNWTGDLDYARKLFPVIKLSLAWEKRNWDADGDGLYDDYAGIWASDALMYNSGGTAVGSAYNYRANKMAAEIATLIGEDPAPYIKEAAHIKSAMDSKLWLKDKGWWAEYVDLMGKQLVHPDAAVWSIYTPIGMGVGTVFQKYQATRYIDNYIPHIPVKSSDLPTNEKYSTVSSSGWMPYYWSVNNVAFGEVGNTALAYWQAGRPEAAFNLFKSAVLDGMYLGKSPGNIGQISYYDATLGECYRDFGDVIGVYSLDIVQGLFGIYPDGLHDKLTIRPGFPGNWSYADIEQKDIDYHFKRQHKIDTYTVKSKFKKQLDLSLELNAPFNTVKAVLVNGQKVPWKVLDGINRPLIAIDCGKAETYTITVEWAGEAVPLRPTLTQGVEQRFVKNSAGNLWWWQPVDTKKAAASDTTASQVNSYVLADFDSAKSATYTFTEVNIDQAFNAKVTDIFTNRYLAPRSPYTTLQTPAQGVGEWCQPKLTYTIDDSGLREAVKGQSFKTPLGIPFRIPKTGDNIAFTTLWDNYPDAIKVPVTGKASKAYLLMAGTTNPMQYGIENGRVTVTYKDGTKTSLSLKNPETWCPIQEDYFNNGLSFSINAPRPYRVAFKTAVVSRDMETAMDIKAGEVSRREIKGGAGLILSIPLDNHKELASIEWQSIANEVIIGMMGITLQQ